MDIQKKADMKEHYLLTRALSFFDVACMGFNCVVGAGIFLLAGQLNNLVGMGSLLVFPVCGMLCFAVALCFAELGSMYDETGGAYLYTKDTFGPFAGFLVGWIMWLASIIGWASVASGFGLYCNYFLTKDKEWLSKVIVTVLVLGLSGINYYGVKPGARSINFFSVGKFLSLLIFIFVGVFFVKRENFNQLHNGGNFSMATTLALYAYTGFEFLVVPAGEMRNPQKHLPRIIITIFIIVTFLYIAIQYVAMGTYPQLSESDKPLADAAFYFMGPAGGVIIGLGALLSIGGINAGIALTSPRSLYVLSADGFFPPIFAKIHRKYHTPYLAIIANTALTLLLSLTGSFRYLIAASVMVSILQYIPTCLAVIALRKKNPEWKRGYKVPGGYCIPILALIICGWLLYHVELKVIGATALAIAASLPFYFRKR
ncbi:MAG: amino acid permease [Candidatus Kuenenia sp.]|nr:amino acid permease [Candidatus Kuenenia hertensis]